MGKFTTRRAESWSAEQTGAGSGRAGLAVLVLSLVLQLSACGGGAGTAGSSAGAGSSGASAPGGIGGGGSAVPMPLPTAAQAARFLAQSTFGARQQDLPPLMAGGYEQWVNAQMAAPMTAQTALLNATPDVYSRNNRMEIWWGTVVGGPDQLRQRMALALSEIFVVSDQAGTLQNNAHALTWYWDLLARDAFGNFRTLLEDVTLSPQMGVYLNTLGNQKPDPVNHVRADENFAREVMQLFTIGLFQLNPDGTTVKDAQGQPLPSYSQADVSNLARVFTGWSWPGSDFYSGTPSYLAPMAPFDAAHDMDAKTIVGGVVVPAGGTTRGDLKLALDTLFNHPNTPPFIAHLLIQRLVTSNPTPGYVGRVAQVFINNGAGVRGDLAAVVRAILFDTEARSDAIAASPAYGKRREPLLTAAHLWRALDGHDANGKLLFWTPEDQLQQAPLSAPSVFNFFKPGYVPPGALQRAGLVGPEFQLATASNLTLQHNFYAGYILGRGVSDTFTSPNQIMLHVGPWLPLAAQADSGALIDQLNLVLMAGQMPTGMRQALVTAVNAVDLSDGGTNRVLEAAFLIFTSQQYQVQR